MKSAVLEIGTESLPARFLKPTLSQLERKALELTQVNRLKVERVSAFGTPMRLAVLWTGLGEKSDPFLQEITGPPAQFFKDSQGRFTAQALGFARSQGVRPEELKLAVTPKGEFVAAHKTLPSENAAQVLSRVFLELIKSLEFPKTLEWEESRFRFARPIRNLLALYGKRVLRFEIAGVRSGNKIRGLACMGYKPIAVPEAERYLRTLRDRCILVDVEERVQALLRSLDQAAKRASGRLDKDAELLEQVVCLTEYPVAVLGHFEKSFLELPQSLLTTVLKDQLKFFPVLGEGGLEADFIGVRDGLSEGQKEVQEGYERVLQARLSDAKFFFAQDRQTSLQDKRERLSGISFQKGLGSMLSKSERVGCIARWLCEGLLQDYPMDLLALKTIADLCYADLVTQVVQEFPELQGAMGGVYARLEGLGERVALGLEEFYFPVASKTPIPTHLEGCLVSLAGKIDTLSALFYAGLKPSGSEDPFALRRSGNGIVRILLEKQIPLPLSELVEYSLHKLVESLPDSSGRESIELRLSSLKREILEFLWQRAEALFLEQGYRIDETRSVAFAGSTSPLGGLDNLPRTFRRLAAVHALRSHPDFLPLAQAFKRASNILKQAHVDAAANGGVSRDLFIEAAEQDLFQALCQAERELEEKLSQGDFQEGLRSLVALKPQLDRFFDQVLVMAEDTALRQNRLQLIARLVRAFKSIADISYIQN